MTLQPYHFKTPESLKEEDYIDIDDIGEGGYDMAAFQKALSEWESLYGDRPEPEWIPFNANSEPEIGQVFLWKKINSTYYFSGTWRGSDDENMLFYYGDHLWADKATYDTRLKQWKDHQVRYQGFIEEKDGWFRNDTIRICFHDSGKATIKQVSGSENMIYYGTLSPSLFEMICKENGIELSKLQA